jgi:altronate dehydratase large subunit
MEFLGYRRSNGAVGTRNYVGVFSMVGCANEVAEEIVRRVQGTTWFLHGQGCGQTSVDTERVNSTLAGLGNNPNIAAVLLVSLGCESSSHEEVARKIATSGKRVDSLVIQDIGGAARSVAKGSLIVQDMVQEASAVKRTPCPISEICMGLKCGASDTTQGLAANPALGVASDLIVDAGGDYVR